MDRLSRSAPAFDPHRILAATPADGHCTYTRNSVTDAQWTSVLFRVGHRNDAAGRADMGAAPHPRLVLTRRGSVAIERDDDGRRKAGRLAPGRSWLVPPGAPLRYEWSGASTARREMAMLVLPQRDLLDAAGALDDQRGHGSVHWDAVVLADDGVVGAVMAGMAHALTAGADDLYAQTASAFLLQHLLVTYGSAGNAPVRVGREDARVRAVIDYLHENLHRSITLADMAGVAALSSFHFLRVFQDATGETPRRYLNRLRIDAARRLLVDPDLSVTDIAALCGFGTASHFATAFKHASGVSPRAYRRQLTSR